MRIVSVVGARPQFVKLAPVHLSLTAQGVEHIVIHTGQHYDEQLSGNFFREFDIPQPNTNLNIGSHSHAVQQQNDRGPRANHNEVKPGLVVAYGDTNSTLACAIVCSKLPFRLAHIEAGLRSHNRLMPEELNHIITDHSSDILLAPTETAMQHLTNEGLENKSHLVGDVMIDIL